MPSENIQHRDPSRPLGLTAYAAADVLRMIDFDKYKRDDSKIGTWVKVWSHKSFTEYFGAELTIYDLIQRITHFMEERGYRDFSVAEVLQHLQHPGVDKADAWMTCPGRTHAALL